MGLILRPEIKIARKILQKHSLKIPFDLDDLVKKYANLIYKHIPVDGVDGICLHLNKVGKTPIVVVNTNSPRTRQKFTLAHELGHIIIPWHYGTIVDDISQNATIPDTIYWEIEKEANLFASELLMPFDWVQKLYKINPDPEYIISKICLMCGVSAQAASIRTNRAISEIEYLLIPTELISLLYEKNNDWAIVQSEIVKITRFHPEKVAHHIVKNLTTSVAFCTESNGVVIQCGGTLNAHSHFQWPGEKFTEKPYTHYQRYTVSVHNNIKTHWWILDNNLDIPDDSRNWQEILKSIATEISPNQGIDKFTKTVNAKLSGAHGQWRKKNPDSSIDIFVNDSILRFNNPDFKDFAQHPDFRSFIKKRCYAFSKAKK